jgi:predicted DNA-binding antitoxin AbrB/MazE fold protein
MGVEVTTMAIKVEAVYEGNGVLRLEEPVALEEKAKVRLVIEVDADTPAPVKDDDDPTGWKTARRFIGMWKGAPKGENIARDHDKYLYK